MAEPTPDAAIDLDVLLKKVNETIEEDDQMQRIIKYLKRKGEKRTGPGTGSGSGRGRPPKLDPQEPTRKLLLQLESLRRRLDLDWDVVEDVFKKITDGDPLQGFTLESEIQLAVEGALQIPEASLPSFYQINVRDAIAQRGIGPYMRKFNIQRHHLFNPSGLLDLSLSPGTVSNGIVIDLANFSQHNTVHKREILQNLGADLTTISDQTLNRKIASIVKHFISLKKSINKLSGDMKMNLFLEEEAFSANPTAPAPPSRTIAAVTKTESELSAARVSNAGLRRQIEEVEKQCGEARAASGMMKEALALKEQESDALRAQVRSLQESLRASTLALKDAKTTIKDIKGTNVYRRNRRKEQYLRQKENNLECSLKKIITLKRDKKLLQTAASNARRKLEKFKAKAESTIGKLRQRVARLQECINGLMQSDQVRDIRLKDEKGHFTLSAKSCVMALVGECEVGANRTGEVIKTVINHVLNARVPEDDLPSQRSALRFSDASQAVSKQHVGEIMLRTPNFDWHIDGTSRSGKKYVCQAINTPEGSCSLGYTAVAKEDASTLVEVAVQMLEEVADLSPEEDVQVNFLWMLEGLSSVMSDRAKVMGAFFRGLQEERRVLLQSDEGLTLLHCNAHFLLGLASEVKKVLLEEDRSRTTTPPGYHRPGECYAYRYTRMACDILGPRGDDKSGCRDTWVAYCQTVIERPSAITSFRDNRFNNSFQGPADLHFHRMDIQHCLETYLGKKRNGKIQTVLSDSKDETIGIHLIALGLIYFRITGPYWKLLGQDVHYLDFYKHVGELHASLQSWQQDPAPALSSACPPVFSGVVFTEHANQLASLLAISDDKAAAVKALLQKLATAMVEVTERQLADFLPGGQFHDCQDPVLRARLQHSLITNLIAKQCFADLDFSLFKRRNSSLHHHTTLSMLKRNKSITSWFLQKTDEEKRILLAKAEKKGRELRLKHQEMDAAVHRKRREVMEEEREKREQQELKQKQRKTNILQDLKKHNGPCVSVVDVDRLPITYCTNGQLKAALRNEILYHKVVVGAKSPLLVVTGNSLDLMNRLRVFLGGEALEQVPNGRNINMRQPARRHPPSDSDMEDADDSKSDSKGDKSQESQEREETTFETAFKFHSVGEVIAVYYVDNFYIGEVVHFDSDEAGTVSFLESARGQVAVYRWPSRPDSCVIPSTVVFARGLVLAPFSSSGRAFVVESPRNLPGRYQAFKKYLVDTCAL